MSHLISLVQVVPIQGTRCGKDKRLFSFLSKVQVQKVTKCKKFKIRKS